MKKHFLPLIFLSIFMGCSGSPLIDQSPNADETVLKLLSIMTVQHGNPDEAPQGNVKIFANNLGIQVTLEEANLSWGHWHLISEGSDPECEAGHDTELEILEIQNLMGEDSQPSELISGFIADHSYCQYGIHFINENEGSNGYSLFVSGSWNNGLEEIPFIIALNDEFEIEGEFVHPLHFHEGESEKTITFGFTYNKWFEDISFDETPEDLENAFLINFKQNFAKEANYVKP
ncbi:MAG: hypothetical protein ACD_73C00140G0004 [uncultured bacterium]|nr:MAG: hypothetical protein ACD_73C00140G0004 [uncultured bacterium]